MKNKNIILLLIATLGVSSVAISNNRLDSKSNGHSKHSDRSNNLRQRSNSQYDQNRNNHNHSSNQHNNSRNYSNKPKQRHSSHRNTNNRHNQQHRSNRHSNNNLPFNSPYRDGYKNNYGYRGNKHKRNKHGYRRYNNYNYNYNNYRHYNRYYSNYKPYYQDQYRYRPVRGLGHYFHRTGYGYGHWHDNSWCAVNHPQSFYYDYYSDYPYQNGWSHGDGDYGISFYFDF